MWKRILFSLVVILIAGSFLQSCKITYSFTGANLSPEIKTYTVYYIPNRARLVNPTLSQLFTEELREKLQRQTSLDEIQDNGDLIYEGQIDSYDVRPMSIQKEDLAAQNRLTISVKIKYTNNIVPDESFEKTFTAYEDFDSTISLSEVEDTLIPEIVEKLLEDIFNATIANW